MRFLHTSDWHLGRQFHHVSLLEDQRHILGEILAVLSRESVDAVLVSGDIYDRSVPSADAITLLDEIIEVISQQLEIPLIIIAGNHDSGQRLSFAAQLLKHSRVYILGKLMATSEPVILNDDHGEVAFYGIPYADPAHVRDVYGCDVQDHQEAMQFLTGQIKQANIKRRRSVVLAHCFIDGGDASDSERPLSVGGADKISSDLFSDFDYVALGHLHRPQYKGEPHIRYSGSILKYSFSEVNQKKSVTIVDMDETGHCKIAKIPLLPRRDMRIIEGCLEDILATAKADKNPEDYIMVRLLDTHALYEPMAKLREVYPNILQMEKPNLNKVGERQLLKRENLKKGEMPMFLDFYQQMCGEEISDEGATIIARMLDSIHQGELIESKAKETSDK